MRKEIFYYSNDGRKFEHEIDCLKYEKSLEESKSIIKCDFVGMYQGDSRECFNSAIYRITAYGINRHSCEGHLTYIISDLSSKLLTVEKMDYNATH